MPRSTASASVLTLCFLATQTSFAQAQQSPQLVPRTQEQREQNYRRTHRVRLDMHVDDSANQPIRNLEASDFTVLDNDQRRTPVSFERIDSDTAANIILVLDEVNNSASQLKHIRNEIASYLHSEDRQLPHPIALAHFSAGVLTTGKSSSDRDTLLAELLVEKDASQPTCIEDEQQSERSQLHLTRSGSTQIQSLPGSTLECMNHRFISSISGLYIYAQRQAQAQAQTETEPTARTILIWIGPGWPALENPEFGADSTSTKQNFFDRLVATTNALQQARITLDAVALIRGDDDAPAIGVPPLSYYNGTASASDARARSLNLHIFSTESGGQVFTNARNLPRQIRACVADADDYYSLSFDTPPAQTPGEYHALRVHMDRPYAKIRTRTLYYAEP